MYYSTVYDNFDALQADYPDIATQLLEDVGEGEWQNNELYYYDSIEDFAEYELTDGWYAEHDFGGDFNGAPNPLDYIDFSAFGSALLDQGDGSVQWTDDHVVITTSYGW